jgi:tetratricopeptide (TPR) repeat protein
VTTPCGDSTLPQSQPVSASDRSVAIGHIGEVGNLNVTAENLQLILQAAGDQSASAAVLDIRTMRVGHSPFVGRQTELSVLRQSLVAGAANGRVVLIAGAAGVGKTALALRAVQDAVSAAMYAHSFFVDMRGYEADAEDRARPDGVYASLLQRLGVRPQDLPFTPAEQATLYHSLLETLAAEGKSILLWLDNVSETSQFNGLRPQHQAHTLILTSRDTFGSLGSKVVVDLDVLTDEEAVEVLASALKQNDVGDSRISDGQQAALAIAASCDRLPLALQIVAALLIDEPARQIHDLAEELDAEERRLDNLHYDDRLSVRAALNLSYRRLPDELKRLFRLLSVVPGGDVGMDAARWLMSSNAVRPQLMALVRAHLVQQHMENRWRMHDLVRIYAAEEAASDAADADRAYRGLINGYLLAVGASAEWLTAVASEPAKRIFSSARKAAMWIQSERATAIALLLSAVRRAEYYSIAAHFGVVLGDLLKTERHLLTDFYDVAAATASIAMDLEDPRLAACTLNNFGSALRMRGEYDQAIEVLQRAVELNEANGDVGGASTSRTNIATVRVDQEMYDEAIALYLADLQRCRESDPPHPYNEAGSLTNLAATYGKAGRTDDALLALKNAVVIRRDLKDPAGLANSLLNLGAVLQQAGEGRNDLSLLREARDALLEAHKIYTDTLFNESGHAMVANNLGVVQCQLGDFVKGLSNMESAVQYFTRSQQPDRASATRAALDYFRAAAESRGMPT